MSATTTSTWRAEESVHDACARAHSLRPALADRAVEAERARCIPAQTVRDLQIAELIDLHKPRRFGGAGGSLADAVRVSRELASACLSSGWVHGVFSGHLMFLAHFPLAAQAAVYEDPNALVSSVLRAGRADVRADCNGFRLREVEGRFCSGVDHCSWILVGAESSGERRFFLVPREKAEIVDDWQTIGMRGTGSKSVKIADAHVPAEMSVPYDAMCNGTSPGAEALDEPFFRQPVDLITPYSLIGNSLGGAFAALEALAEILAGKAATPGRPAGPPAVLSRLGEAAAAVNAAYAVVLRDAEELDDRASGKPPDLTERARLWGNRSYAAQTARRAVNDLFELGGGSGLYDGMTLQRWWRDVNGACNHIGVAREPAFATVGQALVDERLGEPR